MLRLYMNKATGSTSTLIGETGGIEPLFSLEYTRKSESLDEDGDSYYTVTKPIVKQYMEQSNIDDFEKLPDYFVTSSGIHYKDRIDMQSAFQKYIDASISSTVNLPNETTVDEISDLYMYAWKKGCKGITVFRNGCKRAGILTTDDDNDENNNVNNDTNNNVIVPEERPEVTDGTTIKVDTGCGKIYLTLNVDDEGNPIETFINNGSDGGCNIMYQGLSRMISLALRSGVPVEEVIDQLQSVNSCSSCLYKMGKGEKVDGASCPDIIGKSLKNITDKIDKSEYKNMKLPDMITREEDIGESEAPICPECGAELEMKEGCMSCQCGYSKCG